MDIRNFTITSLYSYYRQLPKVAKSSIWFTLCNFIIAGLGFFSAPIFTRVLLPEEYGKLTLFIAYEQIFLILATWEIQNGAYQRALFKYDNWHSLTFSTTLLLNLLTLTLFSVALIFSDIISDFTLISKKLFIFLFVYFLTQPAYICWTIRKKTKYEYKSAVLVSVLYAISNILLPYLAVRYLSSTANMKFGATLLTSSIISMFFYFSSLSFYKESDGLADIRHQWKYMIAYQAPLVLHSLSYLVLGQADRVMIGKMCGNSQAAFYGIAYTIGMAVTILQNSLTQAMTPWRYQKLQDGDYSPIKVSTDFLLFFIGVLILILISIAPELTKLLFTDSYYEAIWCIPPVAASVFFMFLYSLFVSVETYYERTKYVMYVSVSCGIINIVLNLLFIPIWGYVACAYTTLFSYVLFSIFHYFSMRHICEGKVFISQLFDIRTIVIFSSLLISLSIIISLMYNNIYIRCIFVAILFSLLFFERKKIQMVYSQIKNQSV